MYDLIMTLWGNSGVLDTGLSLEQCNAAVAWLYENQPMDPDIILTCEAPLWSTLWSNLWSTK